jgi:hypothetical protein
MNEASILGLGMCQVKLNGLISLCASTGSGEFSLLFIFMQWT